MVISRRQLLAGLSSSLVASAWRASASASHPAWSTDVESAFRRTAAVAHPVANAPDGSSMRFGYAAITWGNAIEQAIDDIAASGFRGIQLRGEAFQQFGDKPAALKELLERHRLAFAVLSSGNLSIDPAREQTEIGTHVRHAEFVRAAGGQYLQVIDERPKGRAIAADDYRRLGRLLTELGKRTADVGVPLVYHHHMNSLGERPNEIAAVLEAADRKHVGLLFDTAHYQQGGGDPVAAIKQYASWIQVVHLKDVRPRAASATSGASGATASSAAAGNSRGTASSGGAGPSAAASSSYEFVELGRGRVDLPGVFAALASIRFGGWAIVELDRVPDPGRTPKESAEINKRYLIETMHQRV